MDAAPSQNQTKESLLCRRELARACWREERGHSRSSLHQRSAELGVWFVIPAHTLSARGLSQNQTLNHSLSPTPVHALLSLRHFNALMFCLLTGQHVLWTLHQKCHRTRLHRHEE
eukprot:1979437-Rhodomonas_salina.2